MKSAVCLFVRNEARDVQEWIAFHSLAGFDSQIIFDTSNDGTTELIQAASHHADIRFHDWPNRSRKSQALAYNAACKAYKLEFDWIAFLDSDEFFLTTDEQPVNHFLAGFEGWSAIGVSWALYGSSGYDDFPPGLVTECFTRRADTDFFPARHVKSIIRPRAAVRCRNPHYFDMRKGVAGRYCDPCGTCLFWLHAPDAPGGVWRGVSAALPDYSVARINHYFTRSRAHWRAKVERGFLKGVPGRTFEEFAIYDRNEICDPIALRHLGRLRERLAVLRGEAAVGPSIVERAIPAHGDGRSRPLC